MDVKLSKSFVEFCEHCGTFQLVTHFVGPKKYMMSCRHYWSGTADYFDTKSEKRKSFVSDYDKKKIMRMIEVTR